MNPPSSQRSVLFADICGSTPLYADTGNQVALRLVAERLDEMSRVVVSEGGKVIRSKGDDVLCTFEDSSACLRAATRITHQLGALLDVRAAGHIGDIIEARRDLFGDAVNLAARLLALARPGEVLVSGEFHQALSSLDQKELQFFDRQVLRGITTPVDVYKVTPIDADLTYVKREHSASFINQVSIQPKFQNQRRIIADADGPCLLGRSTSCDIVVPERCVSRTHAVIEARGDKISITDKSSLGTWVRADTGEILLRRESQFLTGRGTISLGEPARVNITVDFELTGALSGSTSTS